jgi:hypothetical protein
MKTALIFSSLSSWILYEATGAPLSVEAVIHMLLAFFETKDSNKISATNLSHQLELAQQTISILKHNNIIIQEGTDQLAPIIGFNKKYDHISIDHVCTPLQEELSTIHGQYRCLGLNDLYGVFIGFVEDIIKAKGKYQNQNPFQSNTLIHLIHLVNTHIIQQSEKASNILTSVYNEQIHLFVDSLITCLVINVVISTFAFLWMMYLPFVYDRAYKAAMTVFRRLSSFSCFC